MVSMTKTSNHKSSQGFSFPWSIPTIHGVCLPLKVQPIRFHYHN